MTRDHWTTIKISITGIIETPGIDHSGELRLWKRRGNILVARKAPGKCWSGVGQQVYVPTKFIIFELKEDPDSGLLARELIDFGLRSA